MNVKKNFQLPYIIAGLSGLILSSAFAPLNWNWLAWISLVPLYLCSMRRKDFGVFRMGYLFGFIHFSTTLFWLSEIFILCPFGLALILSFLPAFWLWIMRKLYWNLAFKDPLRSVSDLPDTRFLLGKKEQCILIFSGAFLWCFTEWIRSWIFTGLPWNLLGASQAYNPTLLAPAAIGGTYLISFFIALFNMENAVALEEIIIRKKNNLKQKLCWPAILALSTVILGFFISSSLQPKRKTPYTIKIATIQGSIPPSLVKPMTMQEAIDGLTSYLKMSFAAAAEKPDLIMWPETALPFKLRFNKQYFAHIKQLIERTKIPMLIGSIDLALGKDNTITDHYNTAILINKEGEIDDMFQKIHTVPFGEYFPLKSIIPAGIYKKIENAIGMGPGLTQGTNYTIFNVKDNINMGVNICFEDVFPEISQEFVKKNANLLAVITNDGWYNESSGPEQHTIHSIMRAVEFALPVVRTGNESESCYITPRGELKNLLRDPQTHSRFYKGWQVIEIPVPEGGNLTIYAKYPFLFKGIFIAISAIIMCWIMMRAYEKKASLNAIINRKNQQEKDTEHV